MCVNYVTVSRQLAFDFFRTSMEESDDWRDELYQDYVGPIIVHDEAGNRKGLTGTYGFIPKRHMPPGQRLTTMNARAETVGQLRTYKSAWAKSQLCLIPMVRFFEPNWNNQRMCAGLSEWPPANHLPSPASTGNGSRRIGRKHFRSPS